MIRIITLLVVVITSLSYGKIIVSNWDKPVSPTMADYVKKVIQEAEKQNAKLIILQLDTPGGLESAMRNVIKLINNTKIPFVVYVYPQGARATSAGAIITVSADVAVMAPLTNIGSASPVSAQGKDIEKTMKKKIVNDMVAFVKSIAKEKNRNPKPIIEMITKAKNYSAKEALKLKIIDFIATDINQLLQKLEGKKIKKLGNEITLKNIKNQELVYIEQSFTEKLLSILANPTIAYFLLMIGFYGIFFELYNPGTLIPGTIGAISLLLALYSLNMIDANWLGVLLIAVGVLFFALEVITPTFGGLSIAGVISIGIGSLILFNPDSPYGDISLQLIIPVVLFSALFFIGISYLGIKAQTKKSDTIVGKKAKALTDISPSKEGKVMFEGAIWNAKSTENINKEEEVIIEKIEGLTLIVKPINQKNIPLK